MAKVGTISDINERNRAINDKPVLFKRENQDSLLTELFSCVVQPVCDTVLPVRP
jgi:hypothetical protein